MFAVKKAIELGVCLMGYYLGLGFGGWGGGIILAFAGLFVISYGWSLLEQRNIMPVAASTRAKDFAFGGVATLAVAGMAYLNWGRTY